MPLRRRANTGRNEALLALNVIWTTSIGTACFVCTAQTAATWPSAGHLPDRSVNKGKRVFLYSKSRLEIGYMRTGNLVTFGGYTASS
jgi:hypothetical protein